MKATVCNDQKRTTVTKQCFFSIKNKFLIFKCHSELFLQREYSTRKLKIALPNVKQVMFVLGLSYVFLYVPNLYLLYFEKKS